MLWRRIGVPIAVIVAFLIALGRVSSVVVDWAAWFSTIGYVGVFWTVFATKAALFVVSWRCLRGPGLVAMGQWNTYTTSNWFPYAQAQPDGDTNYIRNSAKVVIDAYNGTITLYVADAADPIVATYRRIFPTLFKPSDLQRHIRYPEDLFSIQALQYPRTTWMRPRYSTIAKISGSCPVSRPLPTA